MKAERARLKRLQRLERVRAIARQTAMADAAQAENTLSQLESLAAKTRRLVDDYGGRDQSADGADLQQILRFASGLRGIAETTTGDAGRARTFADAKLAELGQAERRRAVAEERAVAQARTIARKAETPILSERRPLGTPLE